MAISRDVQLILLGAGITLVSTLISTGVRYWLELKSFRKRKEIEYRIQQEQNKFIRSATWEEVEQTGKRPPALYPPSLFDNLRRFTFPPEIEDEIRARYGEEGLTKRTAMARAIYTGIVVFLVCFIVCLLYAAKIIIFK